MDANAVSQLIMLGGGDGEQLQAPIIVPPGLDLSAIIDGIEYISSGPADRPLSSARKYMGRIRFHPDADSKKGEGYAYIQDLMYVIPLHIMAMTMQKEFVLDPDTGTNITNMAYTTFKSRSRHEYLARCLRSLQVILSCSLEMYLPKDVNKLVLDTVALVLTEALGPDRDAAIIVSQARSSASLDWALRECVIRADIIGCCLELMRDGLVSPRHVRGEEDEAAANLYIAETLLSHPRAEALLDAAFDALALVIDMAGNAMAVEAEQEDLRAAGAPHRMSHEGTFLGAYFSHELANRVGRGADVLGGLSALPLVYQGLLLQEEPGQAACRLVQSALRLQRKTQELYAAHPYVLRKVQGYEKARIIQLLCARAIGVFSSLMTFQDPTLCDKMWEAGPESQATLRATTAEMSQWLELYFQRGPQSLIIPGEGQCLMGCLRIVEALAIEGVVRKSVMELLAAPVVRLVCADREVFQRSWVAGADATRQHREDGARVAFADSVQFQMAHCARVAAKVLGTADTAEGADALVLTMERFVMLYRLLGNLHSFYEETCDADQRDVFITLIEAELKERRPSAAVCSNIEANLAAMLAMGDKVRWAQTELKLPEEVLAADESNLMQDLCDRITRTVKEIQADEEQRLLAMAD